MSINIQAAIYARVSSEQRVLSAKRREKEKMWPGLANALI